MNYQQLAGSVAPNGMDLCSNTNTTEYKDILDEKLAGSPRSKVKMSH